MVDQLLKQKMIAGMREYVAGDNPLDPHQIDLVHDTADFLDRPIDPDSKTGKKFDGGSNRAATGSGKTWAKLCMAVASGEKTLIISPQTKLNSQIADTYRDVMADQLGVPHDDIAVFDGQRSNEERQLALHAKILVTTDDSFRILHDKGLISGDPDHPAYRPLVLLDESDMMLGPITGELLKTNYVPNCVTLGFSATDTGVSETLFGGQPRIHDLTLPDAITRGLRRVCYGVNTAAIAVRPKDFSDEERTQLVGKPITEEMADKFAKDRAVIEEVVRFHGTYDDLDDRKHEKIGIGPIRRFPTLVKVPTIDTADRYAEAFNHVFGDDYAVAVSGETPHKNYTDPDTGKEKRGLKTLLEDFNAGKMPRVIIFPQVLGRGTDIANATVMLSVSDYIKIDPLTQNLGRVVRSGDEDYFERYGNDKIAFGANFHAKGARPALFSQVIDGPTIYSANKPRKKEPPLPVEPIAAGLLTDPHAGNPEQAPDIVTDIPRLKQLYQDAELARMEREGIVPPGWMPYEEALEIVGITPEAMQVRLRTIHSGERYSLFGTKLTPEERDRPQDNYPAEALVMNRRGQRLLNAEMVGKWARWEEKVIERKGADYGTIRDVARAKDVRVSEVKRLETYRPKLNLRAIEELGTPPKGKGRG